MKSIFAKLREAIARVMEAAGLIGALVLAFMLGLIDFFGNEDFLDGINSRE